MHALDQARTMASYNRWMNRKLYDACAQLTDEERKRNVGAFFKSIHGSLNHLLLTDRVWMGRFTGRPFPVKSLDQELYANFDELRAEREKEDETILAWVGAVTAEDLDRTLSYSSISNPQPRSHPLWFAVLHLFNHQTHHRGQVTTLLSQRGIDYGVTDVIWMLTSPPPP